MDAETTPASCRHHKDSERSRILFMSKFVRILLYVAVGLSGFLLILWITTPYGPGVSGDSVDYLSTADHLIRSRQFVGYDGQPYLYWPPLYPMLLAGASQITGLDTLSAGQALNAAGFGLIVLLAGWLFRDAFDNSRIGFGIGVLLALTAVPLVILASNIASDTLFIALVLGYALLAHKFLFNPSVATLLPLGLLAGVAGMLRWHGVILIFSVVVLILLVYRHNLKTALWHAFWVGGIAALPFLLWVLGRNYRVYGTLIGFRDTPAIDYRFNFLDAMTKISHWFIPQQITRYIHPLVFGLLFVLLIALLNWRSHQKWASLKEIKAAHLPWLIFMPSLFLFVIFTSIPYDHAAYDDRYYAPLYIFLMLLLILLTLALVIKPLLNRRKASGLRQNSRATELLILGIVLVWAVYPGYRLYKYAILNHTQGEPYYNIYNTRQMQESELVMYLQEDPFSAGLPIYSNFSAAVYFYTAKMAYRAPITTASDKRNLAELEMIQSDWPPSEGAYLVWFLPSQWHHYYTPDELSLIADLEEIYTSPDGVIYAVEPK